MSIIPRTRRSTARQGLRRRPDINLSVDDQFLYVSCWSTGELKQYNVSDPLHPVETGSVRIGGIVGRAAHPARPDQPLSRGPQMVEVSRGGNRRLLHQLAVQQVRSL
jgi:hypothetical protein